MVMSRPARWAAVLALAFVMVGCDRPVAGTARAVPDWHPPTTTIAPPTMAADGDTYAVCATRTCEVSIDGPVSIRVGGSVPGTFAVTAISGNKVDFTLDLDDGGNASGTLVPGCDVSSIGDGSTSVSSGGRNDTSCYTQAPAAVPGMVTFEMPAVNKGVAIIWIAID